MFYYLNLSCSTLFVVTCGPILEYFINWFFQKTVILHCPFWMVMIVTRGIVYDNLIFFLPIFEYIWAIFFKWSRLSHMVWDYVFHFLNCLVKTTPCANVMMTCGINFTIKKKMNLKIVRSFDQFFMMLTCGSIISTILGFDFDKQ